MDITFRHATSGALVANVWGREVRVETILGHGDLGLGMIANLDGEMVVLDGPVVQIQGSGRFGSNSRATACCCRPRERRSDDDRIDHASVEIHQGFVGRQLLARARGAIHGQPPHLAAILRALRSCGKSVIRDQAIDPATAAGPGEPLARSRRWVRNRAGAAMTVAAPLVGDRHLRAVAVAKARSLEEALRAAGPPQLFGLRLWAAVSLALYAAFWLQLDNPFWAGTSAAIVCQPQLGASLRKGWFRMIGTVIGATFVAVLTACFPQDRISFLGLLALWGGICAFAATALRNFASYSAALAGYTAAIIAADNLGATGGASSDVFMLAVWRASEICIGIASAGVILAATDFGGARRRLAASIANMAAEIVGGFSRTLALAGPQRTNTQTERREFVRRVIALAPMIDQTLGESSHVRYHSLTLQTAVHGLFMALDGWRGVVTHLSHLPEDMARQQTEIILRSIPPELRSARKPGSLARWMADPMALLGCVTVI